MLPLIGYANRLSARPGDTLEFKVSSTLTEPYEASLVRIRCADPNPEGPGIREEAIEAPFAGRYASRRQDIQLGSYGLVESTGALENLASFTVVATVWPTTPMKGRQAIVAWGDPDGPGSGMLGLDDNGVLIGELTAGNGGRAVVRQTVPLPERRWCRVWLACDGETKKLTLGLLSLATGPGDRSDEVVSADLDSAAGGIKSPLVFAAAPGRTITAHFNGKLEQPRVYDRALSVEDLTRAPRDDDASACLADWDFSREISSTRLVDLGPHALHGRLVNLPARGMTGSNWTGREMCWRHAPEEYGAIHFHDDDLHDCGWQTKLRCGAHEDTIPFVVCPPKGAKQAELCLIIPTFTYVIYGNHARRDFGEGWRPRAEAWGAYPANPAEHRDYGLSTYNFHSDGSGICHASALRPILTLRPGYFHFVDQRGSGLRHLQADTHLIDWLEEQGLDYDLVTDHELHEEGAALLEPYRVVLTASHPEYHTRETLDAIEAYRDGGGRFVYLGGNGFYWKVALHPEEPGVIEIRRGEGGIRAWAAEPGEYYNAFDGEYGGLWRRNGRPPQQIAGVGFSAQGTFVGSYYRRLPASYEPRFEWLFQGIDDERLGDFGLCGGGAAGFELDRADRRLGTPDHAVVLASSRGHSRDYEQDAQDFFVLVPEEQLTHQTTWPGTAKEELIRADMLFYETAKGGAVFSVGSITFCGSLPSNGYDNNISTMMRNLLDRFLDPNPDFGGKAT
jgi:N,N-dimethylformamidase